MTTSSVDADPGARRRRRSGWWRRTRNAAALLAGLVAGGLAGHEMETSAWQAKLFANYADRLSYRVESGPSDQIAFPSGGPFDERRGYSRIPQFIERLSERGYEVVQQVRMSPELQQLIDLGVAAPYPEPGVTGLLVRGLNGKPIYDARRRERVYFDYEEIPPLIVDTLLFIENRELLAAQDPRSNPTLEWDRMAKATLLYAGAKMGLPFSVEGGSTLATQLEKFRHSPHGRTTSPQDKLRQITAASLKAYRDGLDTTRRRREIVVEYLNTMPLAAAARFGEVHGVGEGLEAWFGRSLHDVSDVLRDEHAPVEERAEAYTHVLALLAALPAPSTLLVRDRGALRERMLAYASLMERQGVLDPELAERLPDVELQFLERAVIPPVRDFVDRKAVTAVRKRLLELTGAGNHYELDLLHLEADASIDTELQERVIDVFRNMAEEKFVAANGFNAKNLLLRSDPSGVHYGLLLFERTDGGNLVRVQADTLDKPFDLNRGAKVELGSTAKLRTLAHYLEIIAELHEELRGLDPATLRIRSRAARDPLTTWVADTLTGSPEIDLAALLDRALDRKYSASTGEGFFTGGGLRYFVNFDRARTGFPTLRVALEQSINLSFVRLMRDLVRYHESRLPYDSQLLFEDPDDPERLRMLTEIADTESLAALSRAYREYSEMSAAELIDSVLRKERNPEKRLRKLTILHYAWYPGADRNSLARWLREQLGAVSDAEVARMVRAYGNPALNLADYGYLASRHTLDLWTAGQIWRNPGLTWEELLAGADEAREVSSRWLFKRRNLRPQNRRLRIRVERDAFARMAPYWQRLGFPFAQLVPSYATALGSSGDRPAALATLLGVIVNDGKLMPSLTVPELRFARDTPYETALRPRKVEGKQVMRPEVARALRDALAGVVQSGTAGSLAGAFRDQRGALQVGGKTGTGDNRHRTFNRWGEVRTSHALNRTASFVFFIGDRYYGVITAYVPGREAEKYQFTSGLPVRVLRLMAPAINPRIAAPPATVLATDNADDELVEL